MGLNIKTFIYSLINIDTHGGKKFMKQNNRKKVFLSLLIAMAFILPTGSVLGAVGEADANEGPSSTPTMADPINAGLTADGRNPYQSLGNCIVDICGINLLPMMPVGEYDITVELEKICGTLPFDCDVKLFLDVYKLDPLPNEEIYCTDFEDPADIYNNWDSIDDTSDSTSGPGGIDTFTWTDKRSHSPTHSFRCTQFDDHYMGNQLDYLETHLENVPDGSGGYLYDEIELQFWHYCDGELVDGGGSGLIPEDYGEVEVSFNYGGTWNTWGEIYTETEDEDENLVWLPESLNVSGVSSTPEIWYRWKWITGPTIQN